MKILVSGCAGFIGTNFMKYSFENHPDDRYIGVDALTYASHPELISEFSKNKNFIFYKADICDATAIDAIFKEQKPDIVINFAAESHVDSSITDPQLFLRTNVTGTGVLLDAARKYGVIRFHQVSTDEVYGDTEQSSDYKFREDDILLPSSPYSASKASADMLVLSYKKTYGLSVSISRSSNNYGECQHTEKLIPKIVSLALRDMPVTVYGDGTNVRNWLYVYDNCEAIDKIARRGKNGEIYNVGSDVYLSNIKIIKRVLDLLNKPHELITFTADRPGHDRRYSLSTDKIERELRWSATADFDKKLRETVEFYKNTLSSSLRPK